MDFWAHQEDARRRTARLIALYAVVVLLLALAAGFLFDAVVRFVDDEYFYAPYAPTPFLNPEMYIGAACLLALIGALCLFSPASLAAGGKSVAESLKGRLVAPQTRNAGERRLLNVVEEMALASGTPVPPVYILEDEPGINAFAAGGTINDAVIGVTRGTVDLLTREELQAVIAHEFSHICNGDMKLGLRFTQLLFGLMCLSDFSGVVMRGLARGSSRSRGGRDKAKGLALLMLLALVVYLAGIAMAFAGKIIQAAVNRQREFLADASSVQFTRSQALASALKKIGGLAAGSQLRTTAMTASYRHLFFCSVSSGLFDTHPSLATRIRRLDPQWDGSFTTPGTGADADAEPVSGVKASFGTEGHSPWQRLRSQKPSSELRPEQTRHAGLFPTASPTSRLTDHPVSLSFSPDDAGQLLREACKEPLEASYMLFGLLLHPEVSIAAKQLAYVPKDAQRAACQYGNAFAALDHDLWLPLIEMAIPALKTFSQRQFDAFHSRIGRFIAADGVFSFREWILSHLIVSQVGAQFKPKALVHPVVGGTPGAAAMVLSALARLHPEADTTGQNAAKQAFAAGQQRFNLSAMFIESKLNPEKLTKSITVLAASPPAKKEAFMEAAARVVTHDARIAPEETMFLRVLSLCLGVPVGNIDGRPVA